jgi:sulfide:quinone oxidoreductase
MRVVILGAGISGHTAALILRKKLARSHEVIVVSPKRMWNWIPSNIWVGVGKMTAAQVTFDLVPVYAKKGITFIEARAVELHPEGSEGRGPFVVAEKQTAAGVERVEVPYDYLINATGPKLDFARTPGLGPEGHSLSVCTFEHAADTARALDALTDRMKRGEHATLVVGTGHGTCTCEGAAFESVFNLEFELRRRGVRDKARIVFVTNEAELGDFGVGGMQLSMGGYVAPSKIFAESLFVERGVEWICGAHVHRVEPREIEIETLDGERSRLPFDFAMLLPPFSGVGLKAFAPDGSDITAQLFAPSGFMKVDADYSGKEYGAWAPEDWPETYQTRYSNVFAIGIAFAPPHAISRPRKSKTGTLIAPAPPRTGMPSAIMARTVAASILDMIEGRSDRPTHGASMAKLGAACVASAGASNLNGSAASITMFPIVPDYAAYPGSGRSLLHTTGEVGLAGHWIKQLLHHVFIYKAKAKPGWWIIPE